MYKLYRIFSRDLLILAKKKRETIHMSTREMIVGDGISCHFSKSFFNKEKCSQYSLE